MKAKITLLIVCLCLAVVARAQVEIRTGTQHVLCDVTMKDGTTYKGYEIELPHSWDKKIKIEKDKEKLTLKSDDVDFFYAYHKKNPDSRCMFKYVGYYGHQLTKKMLQEGKDSKTILRDGEKDRAWRILDTEGPFMEYWVSCPKYRISKNYKIYAYGGDEVDSFLWIKGKPYPDYVPWLGRIAVTAKIYNEVLKKIVKDDPALVKEIEEGHKYRYDGLRDLVMKYMPAPEVPNF